MRRHIPARLTSVRYLVLSILVARSLVAAAILPAAEQGEPSRGSVAVAVRAAREVDQDIQVYQRVVHDAIEVVLQRDGFLLYNPMDTLGTHEVVLEYRYRLAGFLPRLHVSVAVYHRELGVHIATVTAAARANVTLYSAVDELLSRLNGEVDGYLAMHNDVDARPHPVVLAGPVHLQNDESSGASREAPLEVRHRFSRREVDRKDRFADGAIVPLEVTRRGFYPAYLVVEMSGASPVVPEVPLQQRSRFALQGHYGYPQLLGAGIGGRFYPVADIAHVALEFGVGLSGFFGVTPSQVIHLDSRILAGYAPAGRLGWLVQPVFSTGAGVVASFVTYGDLPVPPYTDLYWNVFNAGVEVGRRSMRVFARAGFSYHFPGSRSLWSDGVSWERAPEALSGVLWRW